MVHSSEALAILSPAARELFNGPIDISMVGCLAPEGYEGLLMGIWQIVLGLGAMISGSLAGFTVMPADASVAASTQCYNHFFVLFALTCIVCAAIVALDGPWH